MLIVLGWFNPFLSKLEKNLTPNFTHFEVGVQLYHLHFLLLHSVQIVFAETYSIQNTENRYS